MSCSDCSDNSSVVPVVTSNCSPCDEVCASTTNTDCIVYSGSDLDNLGISTNQGLNDIFQNLNDLSVSTILDTKVLVPSADVKALFDTPFTIISAQGADRFIRIISVNFAMEGDLSIAYSTAADNLLIGSSNSTNYSHFVDDTILSGTDSTIIAQGVRSSTKDVVRVNEAIKLSAQTSNPTTGTGDLAVYITYIINSVS